MSNSGIVLFLLLFILIIIIIIWVATLVPVTSTTQINVPYQIFNTDLCKFLPTCFGQNPATPYARPIFLQDAESLDTGVLAGAVELETNEVVVIFGKRPPPVMYFGFTPYLYDRIINIETGERFVYYASLTDTVNNFSIPETADQLAVVMTRNQWILDDQTTIYQKKGYYVVQLPIPDVLQAGDRISMLTRATYFDSDLEKQKYIIDPGMRAIKITYNNPPPYDPICINKTVPQDNGCLNFKPRAKVPTEDAARAAFELFVQRGIARFNVISTFNFNDYLNGYNTGYDCIDRQLDCRADNRDACYKTTDQINLTPTTMIVTFGVDHHQFNKAIYASIDAYNVANEYGFGNFLAPNTSEFYMITIGYNQNDTIVVPTDFTEIVLAERAYVQLPQNIAPDYSSIIPPVAYLVRRTLQ